VYVFFALTWALDERFRYLITGGTSFMNSLSDAAIAESKADASAATTKSSTAAIAASAAAMAASDKELESLL